MSARNYLIVIDFNRRYKCLIFNQNICSILTFHEELFIHLKYVLRKVFIEITLRVETKRI